MRPAATNTVNKRDLHPPQKKNGDNLRNDFIYKQAPSKVVGTNSIPFVQFVQSKEGI